MSAYICPNCNSCYLSSKKPTCLKCKIEMIPRDEDAGTPTPGSTGSPAAGLAWTKEKPTTEGWYWRKTSIGIIHIVDVAKYDDHFAIDRGWGYDPLGELCEWAGPIPEPGAALAAPSTAPAGPHECGWTETAKQCAGGMELYRNLLDECAKHLGEAAYTADDGKIHDTPIRLNIPALVAKLATQPGAAAPAPVVEGTPVKCPRCDGQGHTHRPPWVAGDAEGWSSTTTNTHPCPPCNGTGILWPAAPGEKEREGSGCG